MMFSSLVVDEDDDDVVNVEDSAMTDVLLLLPLDKRGDDHM